MNEHDTGLDLREGSLGSIFEINELMNFMNRLDEDEPLAYSITSKMIDFITEYYYNKDEADPQVLHYLVNLYYSKHKHIREKIDKAVMKLLNKNYKALRRVLVMAYKDDMPEGSKKDLEAMLSTVFSGIYFDYSTINEAREELGGGENES